MPNSAHSFARPPAHRSAIACIAIAMLCFLVCPTTSRAQTQISPSTPWLLPSPTQRLNRIAFGSCLDQRLAQPIWKHVIEAKPDLFIMLGDNVYGDVSDASLKELKSAYALQAVHPDFAAARRQFPFLATWDDHDYGRNDAGTEFPYKVGTRELFSEFWGLKTSALPDEGLYRAHVAGPPGERVQIILLDLRTFRSEFARRNATEKLAGPGAFKPDLDASKTLLGPAQWIWLEEQLRQPAEIRLIISSIQLLAEGHGWERWGQLPREQARLFDLIKKTDARGVIVLSGDRHRAAIYNIKSAPPYPIHDITSSALNRSRAGSEPEDAGRLGPMLSEDNFGLLQINWQERRLRASLMALSGREWQAVDIGFTDLGLHSAR